MNTLFRALGEDVAVQKIHEALQKTGGSTFVYGLSGSQKHAVYASAFETAPRPTVVLVHNREAMDGWCENLAALLPDVTVLELPEVDAAGEEIAASAKSLERSARRMDVLGRLLRGEPVIVLATMAAAATKGMSRTEFERLSLRIGTGDAVGREKLLGRLVDLGYQHVAEVESMGQFSARGGIVDVFPINRTAPVRIEFFDDEVDSLREFDVDTKRSIKNIGALSVLPLAKTDAKGRPALCLSYLKGKGVVIFDEPTRLRDDLRTMVKEDPEVKKHIFSWDDILAGAQKNNVIFSALMLQQVHGATLDETISITVTTMTPFQRQMDLLASELARYLTAKERILILMSTQEKANGLRELLAKRRLPSRVVETGSELSEKTITIQTGTLRTGFELAADRLVVITEQDVFGHVKRRIVQSSAPDGAKIEHFRDIKPGDYVVLVNHGIGKYVGVETMEVLGMKHDYMRIKYAGDAVINVPTDQVQLLQKYIGSEGETPRLSHLGGQEWKRAKARAKKSVEDIAAKLIEIYAKRKDATGFAFSPDDASQQEFEEAFPFEETADQKRAILEIKTDMEQPKPMDRLLCGDVGFGKTEVAIRAAYKAVMDGKQVAVLVPTTVLAQQHYKTFSERFLNFLPTIDVLSRFRTEKEQRETLARVARGDVDILIGTHAILNANKVQFKNLGLLIVDEEQRFGVKQKDKIRSLAAGIDVLTLSATPIPRTLHMSLVGARDMSIIETPPAERVPVQTYVVESRNDVIAGAIKRELRRGGQVFFVYNRVQTIEKMAQRLHELVPEARILVGHGQMAEAQLERVMMDFYEGEADILLATSIIENGLDVANANTIIVYNADHFGLSQLYQMRGRVGRSPRMAFAYFVYQPDKVITETAEKRLAAMKEFAELGAGFKIAMRDLEIRGAGNLLGAEQHGHIASVGFEMYCKLLEEAIDALQKKKPTKVKPEPTIQIPIEAYIESDYIPDAQHKLEIYQRIAAMRKNEDIPAFIDELIDRFGEPTPGVMRLLAVTRIKNLARSLGIANVAQKQAVLEIQFSKEPTFEMDDLMKVKTFFGNGMTILPKQGQLRFHLSPAHQANVTNFATRVLMALTGDATALTSKRAASMEGTSTAKATAQAKRRARKGA
ncbi:transcription-repair coupling factor [Selenomonas sp.]|uniref:transcription-repair coupling factor n=1 Tax=Selenomonas sp. TaxID=2053611 RepID=UPI0025E2B9E2|nr:transcription-repair coupling factor [Selenomonas sp.]MCI6284131.1 transcription-repair coupling factor [Selenomonas sp.]